MTEYMASDLASRASPPWKEHHVWGIFYFVLGGVVGVFIMTVLGSHKPSHTRRQPVEHCILVDTASDYRDVQCPSGEWRYIGDTLRIRLHT